MSGNPDKDFNINNINNINNVNNPAGIVNPQQVHWPVFRRQAPATRYKVQSKTKAERKVGDYLHFLDKITTRDTFVSDLQRKYLKYRAALNRYTKPAPGTNDVPPLTQDGLRALQKNLAEVYALTCDFRQNRESQKRKNVTSTYAKTVQNIGNALEKDYRTLQSLQPNGTMTLPEIVQASKERTIRMAPNVNLRDIRRVGDAMNSRMLMSITTGDGRVQKGVFTQPVNMDYEKAFEKFIQKEQQDCKARYKSKNLLPEEKRKLRNYLAFFDYMEGQRRTYAKHQTPAQFYSDAFKDVRGQGKMDRIEPKKEMRDKLRPFAGNSYYQDFLAKFAKTHSHIKGQYDLYEGRHKLRQGDNIDCRNSAMTDVAELLGHGDLIARSTPMSLKLPNGKTVKGTFMNFADGSDVRHAKPNDPYFSTKPEDFSNTEGLKSAADLQVLDFICGNTDRHAANMLYRFDDEGKFIGVKGIDNDMAFGELKEQGLAGKETGFLGSLNDIRVISEGMANSVRDLSPAALTMALRSHGLRDQEIEDSVTRLKKMQERIADNGVRIVKDGDWKNITLDELSSNLENKRSMFGRIKHVSVGQAEFFQANVQRMMYNNLMKDGKRLSWEHQRAELDLDDLSGRIEQMNKALSFVDMDDLGTDEIQRKADLQDLRDAAAITGEAFQKLKNEPHKTVKKTRDEAMTELELYRNTLADYEGREYLEEPEEQLRKEAQEKVDALSKALNHSDGSGTVLVEETDTEYRKRQKEVAEKHMEGLNVLATRYVQKWKKKEEPKPAAQDGQNKEKKEDKEVTPHERNVNNAFYAAWTVRNITQTGFQKPQEDRVFTDGEAVSKEDADYAALSRKMGKLVTQLEQSSAYFGSKEYDNMKQYAVFVRDELGKMAKAPVPEEPELAASQRDSQFERTQKMMDTMQTLSEMYLQYREGKNLTEKSVSDTTQKRMLAATELRAFAANNRERFDLPPLNEMYREGLARERENAFANMSPKRIGTYIKNAVKVAKEHPNEPFLVEQAHTELSNYMRLARDQSVQALNLDDATVHDLKGINRMNPIKPPKPTFMKQETKNKQKKTDAVSTGSKPKKTKKTSDKDKKSTGNTKGKGKQKTVSYNV